MIIFYDQQFTEFDQIEMQNIRHKRVCKAASIGTPPSCYLIICFTFHYLLCGDITNLYLDLQSKLTFTIGSVDNFEKNLEQVQVDNNIDPTQFIPVTFVKESEWL